MISGKKPLFHLAYLWFHYLHSNTYNACISVYHSIMVRQEKKFPLFPLDGAVSVSSTDTTTPWTEATAIRSSAYVQSCGIGAKQRSIRCVGGGRGLDAGGESEWWQRCCSLSLSLRFPWGLITWSPAIKVAWDSSARKSSARCSNNSKAKVRSVAGAAVLGQESRLPVGF